MIKGEKKQTNKKRTINLGLCGSREANDGKINVIGLTDTYMTLLYHRD